MIVLPDTIAVAPDVLTRCTALIGTCPEFGHLAALRLGCFRSQAALVAKGKAVAAVLMDPEHIGAPAPMRVVWRFLLARECEWLTPDYVLLVDVALFDGSAPSSQERALYHELCHLQHRETLDGMPMFDDDGRPALRLRAHDVELFSTEIARYPSALTDAAQEAKTALPRLIPNPKDTPSVLM